MRFINVIIKLIKSKLKHYTIILLASQSCFNYLTFSTLHQQVRQSHNLHLSQDLRQFFYFRAISPVVVYRQPHILYSTLALCLVNSICTATPNKAFTSHVYIDESFEPSTPHRTQCSLLIFKRRPQYRITWLLSSTRSTCGLIAGGQCAIIIAPFKPDGGQSAVVAQYNHRRAMCM